MAMDLKKWMESNRKLILGLLVAIVLLGALAIGMLVVFFEWMKNMTGGNPEESMSEMEKSLLAEFEKMSENTTEEELASLLGAPVKEIDLAVVERYEWACPGFSPLCRIRADYVEGKLYRIRWMRLDKFVWQKKYYDPNNCSGSDCGETNLSIGVS